MLSIDTSAMRRRIFTVICLLLTFLPQAIGQEQTTNAGRDFWVMFLPNGSHESPRTMKINAMGDTACTVTVTNPITSWSLSTPMAAHTSVSITLPSSAEPNTAAGASTGNYAFHVTTTASVSLTATFTIPSSSGATIVLPTPALGRRYVALDYPYDASRLNGSTHISGAAVGFVAIDTTTLVMTLPCSIPGHASGSTLTTTLMPGRSYLLLCKETDGSFSGMKVVGDRPFAMFQGNMLSGVPGTSASGDYMYEQAIPIEQWGTDYVLAPSLNRTVGDRYRMVRTTVTPAGDTNYVVSETDLPAGNAIRLQDTLPFTVAWCSKGSAWNGEPGDASMTMVPPMSRGVRKASFSTVTTTSYLTTFYVNIITRIEHTGSMTMDGTSVTGFNAVDAEYSYARISVGQGTHFLENSAGDFVAWVYGVGNVDCYSHSTGWALDYDAWMNHDTLFLYDTVCQGQSYDRPDINISIDSLQTASAGTLEFWSSVVEQEITMHHCRLLLTVLPNNSTVIDTTIPAGGTLFFQGETLYTAGTYTYHLTAANGCDSTVTLQLSVEPGVSHCPSTTTKSSDFWVTFFYSNHTTEPQHNPGQLNIIGIGDQNCEMIIESPTDTLSASLDASNSYNATLTVGDNSNLPIATPYNGGYHVTTDADIWLYAQNYVAHVQDIALVLPTSALDTTYVIQTYPATFYGSEVSFVATEDSTVLTMTVPCDIQGTAISAGTTLTPMLMKGQAYRLSSNGYNSTFSGMRVTSNGKPFAAFQGGNQVSVPVNGSGADHAYEQTMPESLWGTEFVVAGSTPQDDACRILITSSSDSCTVTINGTAVTTLNATQSYEYSLPTSSQCHIVASRPVTVIMYLPSYGNGGNKGDPSSVTIPPVYSGACESRFRVDDGHAISGIHRLVVICDTAWDASMMLDGNPLTIDSSVVLNGYRVHRCSLISGGHSIENLVGPFVAYVYGIGYYESYAFPLSFNLEVDTTITRDTIVFIDSICSGEAYMLHGFNIDSSGISVPGGYQFMDSTVVHNSIHYRTLTLTVRPSSDTLLTDTIPAGGTLFFQGETLYTAGTYTYHLTAANGCDSTVTLNLSIGPEMPHCPSTTTKGSDFWVTFFYSYHATELWHNPGQLNIIGIGDQSCEMIIESPTDTLSATLDASNSYNATLTVGNNANLPVATPYNGGYHVTSDADIWLYAQNFVAYTQDIAAVLPTSALDTTYVVQTYPSTDYGSQVAFVATEDSTVLTMTVPCDIRGTAITAGTTLTPMLMKGQAYRLSSNGYNSTFSGMRVTSNGKPFAAFQGGRRVSVPVNGSGGDLVYEQTMPESLWGTEFVVAGSTPQGGSCRILITSSSDSCTVTIDGTAVTTLNAAQSYEYSLPTSSQCHIVSSRPVTVIMYLPSYGNSGNTGDPSSVTIPPVYSGACESRFRVDDDQGISGTHRLVVICDTAWDGGMMLDGNPLPAGSSVVLNGYRVHRCPLSAGVHSIENLTGPFVGYVYGIGYYESYAFPLNFNLETEPVVIRDTMVINDSICLGEPFMEHGFSIDSSSLSVPGIYQFADSTVVPGYVHYRLLTLTVLPPSDTVITIYVPTGGALFFLSDTITSSGTFIYHITSVNGCDSLITLYVYYGTVEMTASADNICQGDSVTITTTGYPSIYWSAVPPDADLAAQQGQTSVSISPSVSTTYYISIGSDYPAIDSVHISVTPLPAEPCIELSRSFIDFDYPVVIFNDCTDDGAYSSWTFSDGVTINGSRARRQFHYPLPDSMEVTLQHCASVNCCIDTTFYLPTIIRSVWFPNVFTPDQDINNRFGCIASVGIVEYQLFIYNRWGLLVFETTDPADLWDGTHDGTPVPQGAYAYRWNLKDEAGYYHSGVGTITLLR